MSTDVKMVGDPCSNCGMAYDACTRRILSGKPGKACCAECRDVDTHNEREARDIPDLVDLLNRDEKEAFRLAKLGSLTPPEARELLYLLEWPEHLPTRPVEAVLHRVIARYARRVTQLEEALGRSTE